jgi:hypothetical protein
VSRVYQFRRCVFTANDADEYAETRFFDGTKVPARPEATDDYARRSIELGCPSIWACCWQHEITHHALAELHGLRFSPALWNVAHGIQPPDTGFEEEAAVLELQAFLNGSPVLTAHVARLAHKLGCAHAAEMRGVFTEYLKARQVY